MRRLAVVAALVVSLAVAGVALTRSSAHAGGDYRVDVIFDDAHGLIPGQLAEVAGARVGTIKDVVLTGDFKARTELSISSRFAPFHRDAHCTIRPQGLIAENYVDCDPGSPDAPELQASDGHAPTVALDQTTAPVAVTDLFEIWTVPVRERLTLLLDGLGISTAGRGDDVNAILRRANPALQQARNVLGVLRGQRTALATTLDRTDAAVSRLATEHAKVTDFVDRAAKVGTRTAPHAAALGEAIKRLPALLDVAGPTLRRASSLTESATPLLRQLRRATPQVNHVSERIGPFAEATKPSLEQLGPVVAQGTTALRRGTPLLRLLRTYAHSSLGPAIDAGVLFSNLQQRGVAESFLRTIYGISTATGRFDSISHYLPAFVSTLTCTTVSGPPNPQCSARFTPNAARRAPAQRTAHHRRRPSRPAPSAAPTPASPPQPSAPSDGAASPAAPSAQPPSVEVQKTPLDSVTQIVGSLLHPPSRGEQPPQHTPAQDKGLLDYLLG